MKLGFAAKTIKIDIDKKKVIQAGIYFLTFSILCGPHFPVLQSAFLTGMVSANGKKAVILILFP